MNEPLQSYQRWSWMYTGGHMNTISFDRVQSPQQFSLPAQCRSMKPASHRGIPTDCRKKKTKIRTPYLSNQLTIEAARRSECFTNSSLARFIVPPDTTANLSAYHVHVVETTAVTVVEQARGSTNRALAVLYIPPPTVAALHTFDVCTNKIQQTYS